MFEMWLLQANSKTDNVEQTYDFVDANDADFDLFPMSGFSYLIN